MKKLALGLSFCVLIFSSCKLAMPTGIRFKTNADYNFCVAKVDKDLSDTMSVGTLLDGVQFGDNMSLYAYNPSGNSDKQQVLVRMPVQEVPLDFSQYLNNLDMMNTLQNMGFTESFTVPKIDFVDEQDMDLSEVNTTVNTMVTFGGIAMTDSLLDFAIDQGAPGDGFNYIKYTTGRMRIECAGQTGTVTLIPEPGAAPISATFNDSIAVLNLDGIKLYKDDMKLKFSNATNNPFEGIIEPDSKVEEAVGVTYSTPVEVPFTQTFTIPSSGNLKSCEIKTGNLSIAINIPTTWSRFSTSLNGSISGAFDPALSISGTNISLNNKSFTPGDIKIDDGKISVTLNNSKIVFTDIPKVTIKCNVTALTSATVSLGSDYEATNILNQPLPQETLKMINKIQWKPSGVKVTYETNLPNPDRDNKISIQNVKSDFFKIDKAAAVDLDGKTNVPTEYYCEDNETTVIDETGVLGVNEVDFQADLILPGYVDDNGEKLITLKGIIPGNTYNIALKVEPVFEWYKITINPEGISGDANAVTDKTNTGVKLSSMFKAIDEAFFTPEEITAGQGFTGNVALSKLPVYLFCNIPSVFSKAAFEGVIKAYIGDADKNDLGETPVYVLGSKEGATEKNGLMKTSGEPELQLNEAKEVITNFEAINMTHSDFAELLSTDTDGSLCLDYKVQFNSAESGEMTITNKAYAQAGDTVLDDLNTNISLTAVMILPFDFTIKNNPINIDVLRITGKEKEAGWDIMNRTEATPMESDFFKAIESVSVGYEPSRLPFGAENAMKLIIKIPETEDGNLTGEYIVDQTLALAGGTIKLNPSEILSTYPLEPAVIMQIPLGKFWMPREMFFTTNVVLGMTTNGVIEKSFGGSAE